MSLGLPAENEPRVPEWAVELAQLGTWELGLGEELVVSQDFRQLLGLSAAQPVTRSLLCSALTQDEQMRVGRIVASARAATAPFEFRVLFRRSDGQLRHLRFRAAPQLDARGALLSYRGIVLDETTDQVLKRQKA